VTTSERIAAVVAPVVASQGHQLYDVELAGATVRVLVEGATLETLEQVSPLVSSALDEHFEANEDEMPGRWYLEVSSPGLERALRRPEHYRAAVGAKVKVKTKARVEGDRRIEGELSAADDQGIDVAGRRLAYDDIEQARTVFEWGDESGAPPREKTANGKVKQ
jgi:ribosome maturation factor RimP